MCSLVDSIMTMIHSPSLLLSTNPIKGPKQTQSASIPSARLRRFISVGEVPEIAARCHLGAQTGAFVGPGLIRHLTALNKDDLF